MHFILAVEGDICVRTSDNGRWSRGAGVLTAPDILHAVDADGVEVVLIFMDPESDAGAMFRHAFQGPMRLIDSTERAALMHGADPSVFVRDGADEWSRSAARILGLTPPNGRRPIHPRVRKLLSLLRDGVEGDASLEVLAEAVGLSPSRLMHVFTESIGIPLRPYLSWLRLQRAAAAIVSGKASLTEAAHAAGFADAAHMSRSFKRALGVAPSALRPLRCSGQLVQDT
jgi:AraC-like DNA-binding protein